MAILSAAVTPAVATPSKIARGSTRRPQPDAWSEDARSGDLLAPVNWSRRGSERVRQSNWTRPTAWELGSGQADVLENAALLRRAAVGSTMKIVGSYALVNNHVGDESRTDRRSFRLTLGADGHSWRESTPEAVTRQVTADMVDAWERRYFARDQLPEPLADYEMRIVRQPVDDGPRIFELLEREDVYDFDPPPGIRVWEPQEGADEELLAGVRMLSVEEPEPVEEAAPAEDPRGLVKKKLLKADDDDDF